MGQSSLHGGVVSGLGDFGNISVNLPASKDRQAWIDDLVSDLLAIVQVE